MHPLQKAGKRIGTVVVATACNAVLAELVDFAMAAIKGKPEVKNYMKADLRKKK